MNRTVLKPGSLRAPSRGGCNVDLRDISQQARAILDGARAEAQRIIETARRESEARTQEALQAAQKTGHDEGLERGSREGYSAALEQARKQFVQERAELVKSLESMIDSFKASRERLLVEARQDVIALSIAIASRLVQDITQLDELAPAAAVAACREALDLIGTQTEAVILAHTQDCAAIERFCQTLNLSLSGTPHIKLISDANIPRAGVVVTTADGRVDATIPEKIRRIAEELAADWKRRLGPAAAETKQT